MAKVLRALIIEDSETDCALLVRLLDKGGYEVRHRRVESAETLRASLSAETWDIVISDYSIPGFSGAVALGIVREKEPDLPFIFVSGTIGEEKAVEAMKVGAQDYIMKGNLARLLPAINRELREAESRRERKRVEHQMRQLEKFEAIGKLAGGVAHDFSNVIGAIMVWSELGREAAPADSILAEYFQKIHAQSDRAVGLNRQLLAYAGRKDVEPHNLDLNEAVRGVAGLLEKTIGERIEVETDLAPDLHAIRAVQTQLEQILMNLCFNARDAMPHGGRLLIETRNCEVDEGYCARRADSRPGRYVVLSVSDSGLGMDSATMDRIFEPFFTTKEDGKGTGLGLTTVLGVVKQHEGWVEVHSEPGQGTVFHVFLPAGEGQGAPRGQADEAPVRGGTETILVADDHDASRDAVREVLERLGYRVVLAREGGEAIRQFEANRNDIALLLLDIAMAGFGGTDAYARMSEVKPGVPVIFTTDYPDDRVLLASPAARSAPILRKPYGPKVLPRTVRELLDQAQRKAAGSSSE